MSQQVTDYRRDGLQVRIAGRELKLAMLFADYSSIAYSHGKLKRAADARSKAHSLCAKAASRLTLSEVNKSTGEQRAGFVPW